MRYVWKELQVEGRLHLPIIFVCAIFSDLLGDKVISKFFEVTLEDPKFFHREMKIFDKMCFVSFKSCGLFRIIWTKTITLAQKLWIVCCLTDCVTYPDVLLRRRLGRTCAYY